MKTFTNKVIGLGAGLGIAIGFATAANAAYTVTSYQIDPSAGSLNGTVQRAPSFSEDAAIGRIQLNGTTSSGASFTFESFCADIYDWLGTGTFTGDTLGSLGLSAAKNSQLTALLYNVDSFISTNATGTGATADRSAAAQIAIWEIINEAAGASYSATSGAFSVANTTNVDTLSSAAFDDAALLLSNVTNGTWTTANIGSFQVAVLQGANNQTQLVYDRPLNPEGTSTLGAVPEPATWGMMVVGFGAMGAALRRRRGLAASHAR